MRTYRWLRFDNGVDWQHVSPVLLRKLNRLGMLSGKVIDVFSGYRSPKHSVAVGGFANDPHTRHIAVDANVNGKPVGSAISLALFKKVGLVSGNQPNFYNGKPDPSHVQLPPGSADYKAATKAPAQTPTPSASATASFQEIPSGAPPQPSETVPNVYAPGSTGSADFTPQSPADLWQLIASQPLASPESQSFAERAQLASSGTG